jgi:hypothetical protein
MWTNNVLLDNYAGCSGSALYIQPLGPDLIHTTIAHNHGGDGSAIYITDGPFGQASVGLTNTIFVSHTVGISITAGHTVTVDSILLNDVPTPISAEDGSFTAIKNIYHGDPLFANDGYHLTAGSPAIDKGVDAGVTVDIDGEPRPTGTGYDLGADEFILYDLSVSLDGTGSGSVSSTPAGIACTADPASDCTESFELGTTVTLTATADPGSTFAGWGGDCSGDGNCVVTMTENKAVTATFDLIAIYLPLLSR